MNVSGWNNLTQGKLVEATYNIFNASVSGNFLLIMYVIFTATLLIKTKNVTLPFVIGLIFVSMFIAYFRTTTTGVSIMIGILVFELAGVLYQIFFKE